MFKQCDCENLYFNRVKNNVPFNEAVQSWLYVSDEEAKKISDTEIYLAGCPFCGQHDKLKVNPNKELVYCVECKEAGDIIYIVGKIESMTPLESVKELAKHYNINITDCSSNECRSTSSS